MTNMDFFVNYVDADVTYFTTPADYIEVDLTNDYLIWSEDLDDLMTHEPTADELNEHASVISDSAIVTVAECLLMDYSHNVGGSYYTHLIMGMGENKRYVFAFSFDGATAMIPRLEAWDDDTHTTIAKHVLGVSTPANSWVKAVKTTDGAPGVAWVGTAIAGASNYVELATAPLDDLGSGETSQELYANIKITIPQSYATPAAETFVICVRYTWI
jgi:hypothetical protein